ncbi:hypothetical protein OMK64_14270 [Cellulomonas fimi]|uniref:hypothetical protein n=1 Tax=Cellulomonas fimi TaxID=1708 RepID=UPI00234DD600|nr:hypothetical protein [Cellulomonas fimi]MDC7122699.1 hypothetical protein [Cellulomonas fimi]
MTDDPHGLVWNPDRDAPDRHDPDRETSDDVPAPDASTCGTRAPAHGDDWSDVPWLLDPAVPGDGGLPRVPTRPLRAHEDVLDLLLEVVGPERAGPPALWFVLLDADDRCLPVVLPLAEVPLTASPGVAAHVMHVLASVLDRDAPGGSVLVGLVRASGGDRGTFETSWAPVLRDAADEHGARIRAVAAIGASRARVIEW